MKFPNVYAKGWAYVVPHTGEVTVNLLDNTNQFGVFGKKPKPAKGFEIIPVFIATRRKTTNPGEGGE